MLLPKAIIVVEIDNNWRKTDPRDEVSSFGHKSRIRFRMLFSLSLKCCSVMPFPHAFADEHTQFLVFPLFRPPSAGFSSDSIHPPRFDLNMPFMPNLEAILVVL